MILWVVVWFIIGEEKKRKWKAWPKKCDTRKGKRGQRGEKRAATNGGSNIALHKGRMPSRRAALGDQASIGNSALPTPRAEHKMVPWSQEKQTLPCPCGEQNRAPQGKKSRKKGHPCMPQGSNKEPWGSQALRPTTVPRSQKNKIACLHSPRIEPETWRKDPALPLARAGQQLN